MILDTTKFELGYMSLIIISYHLIKMICYICNSMLSDTFGRCDTYI